MNFERNKNPIETMDIGISEYAINVKEIIYSIHANEYNSMKDHEFISLLKLWQTKEYKESPEFTFALMPHNVLIVSGESKSRLSHATISLTTIKGEFLKLKSGKIIKVPEIS